MGRISVTSNIDTGIIERPEYNVIVWDSKFSKRIAPTTSNELIPTRIKKRPFGGGSYGGTCELVHTGMAYSQYNRMDDDILIGAYVQIKEGKEVIFVGVITSLQTEASAETNQLTYQCRDLWHAVADSAIYQDFNGGISSGGMLGLIAGKGPYISITYQGSTATVNTVSYEKGSGDGQRLPADESGNILVDISPTMINEGQSSIPRSFRGEDSSQIIEQMAEEQELDMLGIVPAKAGSSLLGTITGHKIGDRERTVVFGAASANDTSDLEYMPFIHDIQGTISYDGVITSIEVRGGAISQGFTQALFPAWNTEPKYQNAVLADPSWIDKYPGLYGDFGRLWYIPVASALHGIIPFTDVPSLRAAADGLKNGSLQPAGNTDKAKIWEWVPAKGASSNDAAWDETGDPFLFTQYNNNMPAMKRINIAGISNLGWQNHNFAVVVFAEPQIERVYTTDDDGVRVPTWQFKSLEVQATKFLGNMIYRTGHTGKYPRARVRYMDAPQWRKQIPYSGKRYAHGTVGRVVDSGSTYFDNSGSFTPEADRAVRNTSKGIASIELEIDGLDKSWNFGDTITTILDTDGNVIEDELDWTVRGIDYSLGTQGEAVITTLSLDNETKY